MLHPHSMPAFVRRSQGSNLKALSIFALIIFRSYFHPIKMFWITRLRLFKYDFMTFLGFNSSFRWFSGPIQEAKTWQSEVTPILRSFTANDYGTYWKSKFASSGDVYFRVWYDVYFPDMYKCFYWFLALIKLCLHWRRMFHRAVLRAIICAIWSLPCTDSQQFWSLGGWSEYECRLDQNYVL